MAAKLYFNPFIPAFSSNGAPVAGAKLNVYLTGTTTRTPIYSDEALTIEHPNPVIADAAGKYPNIYLDGDIVYKVVQTDRNDVPIGDAIDPYIPGVMSSGAEAFAINAQNYANDSALSADAAALAAAAVGVYTTVGDGEAATTNGQSFYVASGGEVTLYINNAGTGDEVASLITPTELASTEGAALVGMQQTFAGAVLRSLADWFSDEISVMDFIPLIERVRIRLRTSTANLSTAFQAATDAAASRGGASVRVPSGSYPNVQGITLKQGVTYKGDGQAASIISLPASPSAHMFKADTTTDFDGGGLFGIQLIGGQDKATAIYDAIDFSSVDLLNTFAIEDCYVHGFRRGYNGSLGTGSGNDRFPTIRFSRFWDNTVGVFTNEHAMLVAVDLRVNDIGLGDRMNDLTCALLRVNYNRIGVGGTSTVTNAYFSTCTFFNNSDYALKLGSSCSVSNSLFVGTNNPAARGGDGDVGILVEGDHVVIDGSNRFGQAASSTSFADAAILIKPVVNTIMHGPTIGGNFQLRGSGVGIRQDLGARISYGLVIQGTTGYSLGNRFAVLGECAGLHVQNNSMFYNAAMGAGEGWLSWDGLRGVNLITGNTVDAVGSLASGHLIAAPVPYGAPVSTGYKTIIAENIANYFAAGIFAIVGDNDQTVYRDNDPFITENSGVIAAGSGDPSVTVSHGLSRTPLAQNIYVTPMNAAAAAQSVYVANVTATTFDIMGPITEFSSFGWSANSTRIL